MLFLVWEILFLIGRMIFSRIRSPSMNLVFYLALLCI